MILKLSFDTNAVELCKKSSDIYDSDMASFPLLLLFVKMILHHITRISFTLKSWLDKINFRQVTY